MKRPLLSLIVALACGLTPPSSASLNGDRGVVSPASLNRDGGVASPAGLNGVAATPPMRIVSTSPSITESLFALGLGARVVGVSSFCRYPAEALNIPKVGSYLRPDTELIARLRPDLVFINAGPNQVERQLTSLGLRAITLAPGSLTSVYSTIHVIGEAAGVPARVEALVAELRNGLDRVHKAVAGRPPKRVLMIIGRRTGTLSDLIAVGSRTYLGELVDVAGGINVLSGDRLPEYPRISLETVIRLAPDVVVDAADMGDALESRRRRQSETEAMWRREGAVAGIRANAIHIVTSDAFLVPGPRVVEVAETLASWLHGIQAR
jgi:ABC-type Fe3+-hydroxamate transport system substrate-binding protein